MSRSARMVVGLLIGGMLLAVGWCFGEIDRHAAARRDAVADRRTLVRCGEFADTAYGAIHAGWSTYSYVNPDNRQVVVPKNCVLEAVR